MKHVISVLLGLLTLALALVDFSRPFVQTLASSVALVVGITGAVIKVRRLSRRGGLLHGAEALLFLSAALIACNALIVLARHTNETSSRLNCSKFNETFFSKPTTVQMAEFNSLDLEDQYAIFICGNQTKEPPSIHLATPFAKEGPAIVGFLKAKLVAARGDWTIRDIILVFSEMSRLKTYDVAGDAELMKTMSEATNRVKDADWKRMCERKLSDIRQENSTQPR